MTRAITPFQQRPEKPSETFAEGEVVAHVEQRLESVSIRYEMPLVAVGGALHRRISEKIERWAEARCKRSGWYDMGAPDPRAEWWENRGAESSAAMVRNVA